MSPPMMNLPMTTSFGSLHVVVIVLTVKEPSELMRIATAFDASPAEDTRNAKSSRPYSFSTIKTEASKFQASELKNLKIISFLINPFDSVLCENCVYNF